MSDFTNFRAVYDELTDDVIRARHQFVAEHLGNWFATLDDTPRVSSIIRELQTGLAVQQFLKDSAATQGGMVGSGTLLWPKDPEKRLGMKLLVFREIAEGRIEAWNFGHDYMYAGGNLDDNARALADQLFSPMAKELRRYLERRMSEIPAADRIVSLDHNSSAYREAVGALETLERVIREANDYPDPEEKERVVAEVSAARRIFQAASVRIGVVTTLLGAPVLYLAKKFMDTGIGKAAGAVIDAITALIGSIF